MMRPYARPQDTRAVRFSLPLSLDIPAQKMRPTTKARKSIGHHYDLVCNYLRLSSVLASDPALRFLSYVRKLASITYFVGRLSGDSTY